MEGFSLFCVGLCLIQYKVNVDVRVMCDLILLCNVEIIALFLDENRHWGNIIYAKKSPVKLVLSQRQCLYV